ncbi:FecR domain-containing protein [Sphingomonas psychrotolerans]|uniref:FecR domain-containing protein n=1 Tax=Sphingomonas psychrotolerans TaxID=1327635 RepID=A0ABU3N7Q6_9SPHN|nr:FecR domain-containing protein [Sphingomonas psychrotolerans]MDT8760540.1 FecR domain-containing protein [Sphingomonas psychrotolerans]
MTIADRNPGDGSDALDSQAAHWFARMRAPDAEASRDAFQAWLAQAPENRSAYSRAAEIFAMGKLLVEPDASPPPVRKRKLVPAAMVAVIASVLALGGWALWHPAGSPPVKPVVVASATVDARTVTTAGEARTIRLADGSTVHLTADTALVIDIGSGRRNLKLLRGAARFEVTHEGRPFVVLAGGGSVTARGTIFEVALAASGKVDVRLLQGAIDVALPRQRNEPAQPVRKLVAGESVSFAGLAEAASAPAAGGSAPTPPTIAAALEFEATAVADLVALANRGAARPIRLADQSLGAERVSGRFRIDDTALLARRLGALFGSSVDLNDPREIVLAAAGGGQPADAPAFHRSEAGSRADQ